VRFQDIGEASSPFALWNRVVWRFGNKKRPRASGFYQKLLDQCKRERPDLILFLGLGMSDAACLAKLSRLGVRTAVFLSDDPWSLSHGTDWFLAALPGYDFVFSPRWSNLEDLKKLGCRQVHWLPFAYCPPVHFFQLPSTEEEAAFAKWDAVFFGGADTDRLPFIDALLDAGLNVRLFGGYWDRFPKFQRYSGGIVGLETLRKAVAATKLCLNLTRHDNRDGHVMRSFEGPAMRGCMLMEDTAEHRFFFSDGLPYFRTPDELAQVAKHLVEDAIQRDVYREFAHQIVTTGGHTYADRLMKILDTVLPNWKFTARAQALINTERSRGQHGYI
jgi:hypothetical protein